MEYAGELASAWGGAPRVFRDILEQPIFTATEFFQALASTAQSMASGRSEPYGRANLNGRAPAIHELMSFFPEPETRTLEQYAAQIGRAFPGEEFSIILDRIDIALPEVRTKLTPFLHALFERIGYPVGGIHSCIYAGTYSSTPFGIHIDDCDVLTSSGVGSKKMAFWPREYFEHREEMVMAGSKAHAGVELEALLQEALILEIGPTDLLYWPAGYWHVGVNDTDQFRASLSVGIHHKGSTAGILRKNVPLPFVAPANTNHQALDSLDMQGFHVEENGNFRPVVPERFGKM